MHIAVLIPALALASSALADPILQRRDGGPVKVTADQIGQIAPGSKSCDRTEKPECSTADKAAEYISNSFAHYKINSPAVAAALIATMAQESGDFEFAHNVKPGVPGQGTRNMQSPEFNLKFINSLNDPAFTEEKKRAGQDKVKILAALTKYGNYDFGSAAWFLTTECKVTIPGLEKGDQAGWDAYVKCVGASPGDGRLDKWKLASQVLVGKSV